MVKRILEQGIREWLFTGKNIIRMGATQAYPQHELQLIHRENYYEWLAG